MRTTAHLEPVSAKPRDLPRCILGALQIARSWAALKSSGADPSLSHLEHGDGEGVACSAQGGAFTGAVSSERDIANQKYTLLASR